MTGSSCSACSSHGSRCNSAEPAGLHGFETTAASSFRLPRYYHNETRESQLGPDLLFFCTCTSAPVSVRPHGQRFQSVENRERCGRRQLAATRISEKLRDKGEPFLVLPGRITQRSREPSIVSTTCPQYFDATQDPRNRAAHLHS